MNNQNSIYTPRIGSEIFNTSVMKTDEAALFALTALKNNGGNKEEALKDMHMIDDLLHMERLHFVNHGHIAKTQRGYYRKGSTLYDSLNSIIDGYVDLEYQNNEHAKEKPNN